MPERCALGSGLPSNGYCLPFHTICYPLGASSVHSVETNDVPLSILYADYHTVHTDAVGSNLHNKTHTQNTTSAHSSLSVYATSYDIRMHVYLTIQSTEKRSVYNTAFIIYNITYWDVTTVSTHCGTCIVAAKA